MFIGNLIQLISDKIENKLNPDILMSFQEYLLKAGIFTLASDILAIFVCIMVVFLILAIFFATVFSLDLLISLILAILSPIVFLIIFILINSERRLSKVEKSIPDFLRQLSSMLWAGMSLENALDILSKQGKGPLYDELRRVVVELKVGKQFEDSISDMCIRLNSKDLDRSFKIILNAKKSGGGLAEVIGNIGDDLREGLILKRERKSAVTMSVMFLVLASLFAAPFALGMISVYSSFMIKLAKTSSICGIAPLAAEIYLIIHSIFSGFLIALIMYGDWKKGFKFSIVITTVAFLIFYIISNFAINLLNF